MQPRGNVISDFGLKYPNTNFRFFFVHTHPSFERWWKRNGVESTQLRSEKGPDSTSGKHRGAGVGFRSHGSIANMRRQSFRSCFSLLVVIYPQVFLSHVIVISFRGNIIIIFNRSERDLISFRTLLGCKNRNIFPE